MHANLANAKMELRRPLSRYAVIGIPVFIALAVRVIHYVCWSVSPFTWYNFLQGLDMSSHMAWAAFQSRSEGIISYHNNQMILHSSPAEDRKGNADGWRNSNCTCVGSGRIQWLEDRLETSRRCTLNCNLILARWAYL